MNVVRYGSVLIALCLFSCASAAVQTPRTTVTGTTMSAQPVNNEPITAPVVTGRPGNSPDEGSLTVAPMGGAGNNRGDGTDAQAQARFGTSGSLDEHPVVSTNSACTTASDCVCGIDRVTNQCDVGTLANIDPQRQCSTLCSTGLGPVRMRCDQGRCTIER